MTTISRYRGDTVPDQITVVDTAGVAVNVTGYSFLLTVNKNKDPSSTAGQLFQVAGVIISGPAGTVKFTPSAVQTDQTPGKYYYDIQMTDGGGLIRTIISGNYVIKQDVTK